MTLRADLRGHSDWITQIATNPQYPDMILSASRGNDRHISGKLRITGKFSCSRKQLLPK